MRGSPTIFRDFKAGVNLRDAAHLVDSNHASSVLNVVTDPQGAIRKRDGNSTFGSAPGNVLNTVYAASTLVASHRYMLGVGGTAIYSMREDGTLATITGGATVTSGLPWEFISMPQSAAQGPWWGMNGTDPPLYWTGSGNVASWTAGTGTLPNGKYVVCWNNRVFVAGISSYGGASDPQSALVWSEIGDARNWPATNVTMFDPGDGEPITGLGFAGPYLLVFKRTKMWRVYDADTTANVRISTGTGCVSHRSIAETGPPFTETSRSSRSTFFLSANGVYITDGNTVRPVGDEVRPLTDQIAATNLSTATGATLHDRYYLTVPANSYTLDYDLGGGGWWVHDCVFGDLAVWNVTAGSVYGMPTLFGARTGSAAFVVAFDTSTGADYGVGSTSQWTSSFLTLGAPHLRKRVRHVHMEGSGIVDLHLGRDNVAPALFQSNVFNSAGFVRQPQTEGTAHTPGAARLWVVKFSMGTSTGTWNLAGFEILVTGRKSN